jgi:phosphatidylcholine synthase
LRAGLFGDAAASTLAAAILLSSLYHFSDLASKGDDYSFIGFPAVWNLVAFYLFAFAAPQWVACVVVLACVALTFVPMHWVHPLRVVRLRLVTLAITVAWAAAAIGAVAGGFPANGWAKAVLAVAAVYVVGLTLRQYWSLGSAS